MTAGHATSTPTDETVVPALHADHGDALFAYSLQLASGDRQRAEDLMRETLVRAWRHTGVLNLLERRSVRTWLLTTARNMSIDELAQRSSGTPEVNNDPFPARAGTDEAGRGVEARVMAEALDRLAPVDRKVLVECFYRGRSVAEAATRLGVPPGTVKSRTYNALRALRLALPDVPGSNSSA